MSGASIAKQVSRKALHCRSLGVFGLIVLFVPLILLVLGQGPVDMFRLGMLHMVLLVLGLVLCLVAVPVGVLGLREVGRRSAELSGRGIAITGLVCAGLGLAYGGYSAVATVRGSMEASGRVEAVANLKRIGEAFYLYHDDHRSFPRQAIDSAGGKPLLSWRVAILPYLGADNDEVAKNRALFKRFKLDEPWDGPNNVQLLAEMPRRYVHPGWQSAERSEGKTHFQALLGPKSILGGAEPASLGEITLADGASNTIVAIEAGDPVPWTKPEDVTVAPQVPLPFVKRQHRDRFYALFADAHVGSIPTAIDPRIVHALATWNGGEDVRLP